MVIMSPAFPGKLALSHSLVRYSYGELGDINNIIVSWPYLIFQVLF